MSAIAAFIGRVLIALLFVLSGIPKIIDPSGIQQMLADVGLPESLAQPTGIFEVVAGLLLALGLMTRLVSILLAGFVLLTTFFFHNELGDPEQAVQALKNAAIVGGLLVVFACGQMRWSYDHMRTRRKGEIATAKADERAHEAELRAARAEGRAEGAGAPVADRDGDGRTG